MRRDTLAANVALFLYVVLLLTASQVPVGDRLARIHAFTRPLEFDYGTWLWHAWETKLSAAALGAERLLSPDDGRQTVLDYVALMGEISRTEARLRDALAVETACHSQMFGTKRPAPV